MCGIKITFLLSLLAIYFAPREIEAQATLNDDWSTLSKCTQVCIGTLTSLSIKVIPTVYELKKCSGFDVLPPSTGKRNITWYLKTTYEFFKKIVFDEPQCLQGLLTKIALTIKPFAEQINELGCLDEADYII
ncbi:accessory gland protein Acp53Ea [Drosophila eugracilis]|uniref:accessory gland protein Acp53Ea n=1 Tax=Drosophila eugracilis TaxID=29029 RepID=UPI0007E7E96C|nr:accessory gland protein Acp53Ea [Drosophila eugracilis]